MKRLFIVCALFMSAYGLYGQNFALSTNFLDYADFGTLNIEASCGVARHWSLSAAMKYNPFSFGSDDNIVRRRQRALSTGVRYWPWHIYSGWWIEAEVRYQEYSFGGIRSPQTAEGDRFGGGFGGGYTYMLTPSINLDFGLGVWSGYDVYTVYDCPECGRVVDKGGKFFVLPADFIVALTYIF